MDNDLFPGRSYPLGATIQNGGINFCVFSRNCLEMDLLLFDAPGSRSPSRVIHLNPNTNRTFYYWHAFVKGLQTGQLYGYRACGPNIPEKGLRFDGAKLLVDPYARVLMYDHHYQRQAAARPGNNCAYGIKSVAADLSQYDWQGDQPLQRHFAGTVIYEMHVGGFTKHPSSNLPDKLRGTYAGAIQKIPYLKDLGITAVELLPVQQFDEQDAPHGLPNYWGYNPIVFFAPHRGYSSDKSPLGPLNEFRDMVKALHKAGIEVILDVVFNHTAEGAAPENGVDGPTLCFRGLENRAYYILDPLDQSRYMDYSGCGNSINANHSIVRRMIMDCLKYWVQEMHVDGFRFDLASMLSRDEHGQPLKDPPILWEIESEPVLAGTKIIAEAWDAGGLYQVGSFVGHRWAEWNGQYRDDVRRFIKGDQDTIGRLGQRLTGSRDIYPQPGREPNRSVNFVTCHDGFTLADLVSYNEKHNLDNLDDNRDGTNANYSWNCGAEGPTSDPAILVLRQQQIKNALTILMLSQGTPMLLMGDEAGRTQSGNNNAYCQDNALSWFDWELVQKNADLLRFACNLIRFAREHSLFQQEKFWTDPAPQNITWHGVSLNQPDWGGSSHTLAFELAAPAANERLYIALNAYWEPLEFELPPLSNGQQWRLVIDTGLPSPQDFSEKVVVLDKGQRKYRVAARSVIMLD